MTLLRERKRKARTQDQLGKFSFIRSEEGQHKIQQEIAEEIAEERAEDQNSRLPEAVMPVKGGTVIRAAGKGSSMWMPLSTLAACSRRS